MAFVIMVTQQALNWDLDESLCAGEVTRAGQASNVLPSNEDLNLAVYASFPSLK